MTKKCKGVSPVIGVVLLFATFMLLLSVLQVQLVPSLCKSQEAKNAAVTEKTLETLANELSKGKTASATLDTVHYTKYPFLLFPPAPPLTIRTEKYNISIDYNVTLPNGTTVHKKFNVTCMRLIVENRYFYYPATEYIYESSALFKVQDSRTLNIVPPLMNNESVKLVIVNGRAVSLAVNSPVSINFVPTATGTFYARNITISFHSLCPEGWKNYGEVKGDTVILKGENVLVYVYEYSENTGSQPPQIETSQNFTLIPMGDNSYTLLPNESIPLSVKAVEPNLFTAVPGVRINVSVAGSGKLSKTNLTTDLNGVATTTFTAERAGTSEVIFNASGKKVVYTITVEQEPGFYRTYWLNKAEYSGKTINSTIVLYAKVTKNGEPVAHTFVYFGVNNSSVVELANYTVYWWHMGMYYVLEPQYYNYTNSSGIASVYVVPLENGSVTIYCYSGGSGDELTLKVKL